MTALYRCGRGWLAVEGSSADVQGGDRLFWQAVVAYGEVIEENPDDIPFPSYLLLNLVEEGRPIHVVFYYDEFTMQHRASL